MQPIIKLLFASIYRLRARHFCKFQAISYSKAGFDERVLSLGTYHMIIYLFLQSAWNPTNDIILSRCDTSFISGIISSTYTIFF